jgi:hypothetical protein
MDTGRSELGGYTIAESIAELVQELGAATLARVSTERALMRGEALIVQPDFALWWHCSRFGAEYSSPPVRSAHGGRRRPHWRWRRSM